MLSRLITIPEHNDYVLFHKEEKITPGELRKINIFTSVNFKYSIYPNNDGKRISEYVYLYPEDQITYLSIPNDKTNVTNVNARSCINIRGNVFNVSYNSLIGGVRVDYYKNSSTKSSYQISKHEDEWFIISKRVNPNDYTTYLCDNIDGLYEVFSYLNIKKNI